MVADYQYLAMWLEFQNVLPDSRANCGPYRPDTSRKQRSNRVADLPAVHHDTIGMIVIDEAGDISAGTSSNGATNKIPG